MAVRQVAIRTKDRECPTQVMARAGPWPAVIVSVDAGGVRPAVIDIARRLAAGGVLLVLPDLLYRYGP